MLHEFSILKCISYLLAVMYNIHIYRLRSKISLRLCILESEFAYEFHKDEKHLNCWLSGYFIIKRKTIHMYKLIVIPYQNCKNTPLWSFSSQSLDLRLIGLSRCLRLAPFLVFDDRILIQLEQPLSTRIINSTSTVISGQDESVVSTYIVMECQCTVFALARWFQSRFHLFSFGFLASLQTETNAWVIRGSRCEKASLRWDTEHTFDFSGSLQFC